MSLRPLIAAAALLTLAACTSPTAPTPSRSINPATRNNDGIETPCDSTTDASCRSGYTTGHG
jgi:hypothetical protein